MPHDREHHATEELLNEPLAELLELLGCERPCEPAALLAVYRGRGDISCPIGDLGQVVGHSGQASMLKCDIAAVAVYVDVPVWRSHRMCTVAEVPAGMVS
ncbi:Uncharacterised protein [Mycobacteroides abscessus subsp. massiliense]|nr:Uncharacterised protein [Mycobacteroides abscessus subsp. massiliense]SLC96996.1 Uncharacterised protein [Mycobacteroides abscessus subsp. massiliense]SLF15647.1 Uncharacterised protein [Mycobacteroides abscessus subsp. massiliense]SLF31248.1 Uncharacterised protein [Mycobacteroides abscessus subsp. massiliense]